MKNEKIKSLLGAKRLNRKVTFSSFFCLKFFLVLGETIVVFVRIDEQIADNSGELMISIQHFS